MVVRPVPLSDTQNGPVGLSATPHGLIRLGSTTRAGIRPSETRSVWVYAEALMASLHPVGVRPTIAATGMPAQNEARQGFAAGDFSDQLSEVVMGRRRAKIAFVGSAAGWL